MHPVALPDAGTLDFPIPIGGITGAIAQVTVRLSLLHRQTAALNVSLIGPDGTEVDLSSGNGSGASFGGLICMLQPGGCFPSYTTFDDGGAVPITAGVNPFTGAVHRPEQPLSAFGGKSGAAANGIWRLRVRDSFVGGIGSLVRVELSVREGAPVATADGFATPFQTSLTVTAPGLLGNETRRDPSSRPAWSHHRRTGCCHSPTMAASSIRLRPGLSASTRSPTGR
jgi:hypothetical protein